MRLLLIEDDAALRLGLARQLEADGYRVDQAADGEDGLFQAREYPVDLAIVDLGLPKLNGLTVVQRLRADGRTIPILILTARGSWQDKVVGLEAGADDYLVKPFEYPELAARVKALLRRSLKADVGRAHAGAGEPSIFPAQVARLNGAAMDLTAFEYRVLEYPGARTRAGREQAGAVRLPVPARRRPRQQRAGSADRAAAPQARPGRHAGARSKRCAGAATASPSDEVRTRPFARA